MDNYFLASNGTFLTKDQFDERVKDNITYIEICNKYAFLIDKHNLLYDFKMTDNVVYGGWFIRIGFDGFHQSNQVRTLSAYGFSFIHRTTYHTPIHIKQCI